MRYKSEQSATSSLREQLEFDVSSTTSDSTVEDEEDDYTHSSTNLVQSTSITQKKKSQMRITLPNVAQTCDRYGVSDRAGAAIATASLQDVGFVTEQNISIID